MLKHFKLVFKTQVHSLNANLIFNSRLAITKEKYN